MEGFGLLLGHLVGDYLLQNDWMAKNKVNPHPGPPPPGFTLLMEGGNTPLSVEARRKILQWGEKDWAYGVGHLACTAHCLLYTLSVWAFSYHWVPWWGLIICFLVHWPLDRWRLARWFMENVSGQRAFALAPLAPWSVIVVDNTFHLLTLYLIATLSGL